MFVCRVCGGDAHDEVCKECRKPLKRGPGCALCDGLGGTWLGGKWQICPNCKDWPPHPPFSLSSKTAAHICRCGGGEYLYEHGVLIPDLSCGCLYTWKD
jgi:hypothetical protein